MGLFSWFASPDIHDGLEAYRTSPGAVLLDVRTPQEYGEGHIPGSVNLPLQEINRIDEVVQEEDTPLFVYCYSGARSGQAVHALKRAGYTSVTNIGGISGYRGKVER